MPSPTPARPATPPATATPSPTVVPAAVVTATPLPSPTPLPPIQIRQYRPGVLLHPLAAAAVGDAVYAIESGKLKVLDLRSSVDPRIIAPADNTVEGYPIQDLASLAYAVQKKALYLLDRSGAVYGWDLAGRWWLDRKPGGNSDYSQEYPVDLASDGQAVYLLDTNNGRIWKRSGDEWVQLITSSQLEGGIRLAVAGDLFILVGERPSRPARLLRLRSGNLTEVKVGGGLDEPSLLATAGNGSLLLVDQRFRRLRLVDGNTGETRRVATGSAADILALTGGEVTVLLGPDWLVSIDGLLPDQLAIHPVSPSAQVLSPNNPAVLSHPPKLHMPIAGAPLPRTPRSLPGSPRPYRVGIHEGIDRYASTVGATVGRGTAVLAAGDGVVTRADLDYVETTPAQMDQYLKECLDKRLTPPAIQDKLGGRQVWIDHGNGVSTRYLHLSGIASGIKVGSTVKAGDVIAYAGNSGTPEAADGSSADVHLHFEVRIGSGYLGQWIAPIETRRLLADVFDTP